MHIEILKKRLLTFWSRMYLYPAPEKLRRGRQFWWATALVSAAVLLFVIYFIVYLLQKQSAFQTNAEDMGIMDQAIWSTLHGQPLHQTVCNILNDTNCYGPQGIMRFAIHFEPILFPVALSYFIWPSPNMLVVLQTLVVASGAFPAFWLARLRLRNEWGGAAIALLYLLYPAQQAAINNDFHAVTFTASLLLFVLYFMYIRQTFWLFVFAILAMACKEEIPLLIAGLGLWSMLFQRRWRTGFALTVLGSIWAVVAFVVIPRIFSPGGHPMLIARYSDLGSSPSGIVWDLLTHPVEALKTYVFDPDRIFYLRALFIPSGFLALLAPWVLILAVPTLVINLTSSDSQMHSGLAFYHYSAEIVPIIIFATIEGIVLLLWVERQLLIHFLPSSNSATMFKPEKPLRSPALRFSTQMVTVALLSIYVCAIVIHYDTLQGPMPFSKEYHKPVVTPHVELAQHFIDQLPHNASVSAQSALVPHISQRNLIYLFPFGDGTTTPAYATYIFLDTTSSPYPYYNQSDYKDEVQKVLQSSMYGIVDQRDGYFLLKRGLAPPRVMPAM